MGSLLEKLAVDLPPSLVEDALEMAGSLTSSWEVARAFEQVVPIVPPDLHHRLLTAATRIAKAEGRSSALIELAGHLSEALLPAPGCSEQHRRAGCSALRPDRVEPEASRAVRLKGTR